MIISLEVSFTSTHKYKNCYILYTFQEAKIDNCIHIQNQEYFDYSGISGNASKNLAELVFTKNVRSSVSIPTHGQWPAPWAAGESLHSCIKIIT